MDVDQINTVRRSYYYFFICFCLISECSEHSGQRLKCTCFVITLTISFQIVHICSPLKIENLIAYVLIVTVKILKFGTPKTIAIIVLKIEKFDVTLR